MAFIRNAYLWQCPMCRTIKVTTTRREFLETLVTKCPKCRVKWVLKG